MKEYSRSELHDRWIKSTHWGYAAGRERSEFLLNFIGEIPHDACILEIGCNIGRNLHYLSQSGFTNVHGIEINSHYKEMTPHVFSDVNTDNITYLAAEDFFEATDQKFDLIYTMAVLEHLHPLSMTTIQSIAHSLRDEHSVLITIEDEANHDAIDFVFARNWKDIFEEVGLIEESELLCGSVPGLKEGYVARRFKPGPG